MGGFYEKKTTVQAGDDHVAGGGNDSRFRNYRIRRTVAAGRKGLEIPDRSKYISYKRMAMAGW